jgi:hypothetical protein
MRIHSTLFALATSALVATACGSDSNAPDNGHVGVYELVRVAGDPLPASIVDIPGYRLEVTQGELTLMANGMFVEDVTVVEYVNDEEGPLESTSCLGTYTRNGATLTLTLPQTPVCGAETVTGRIAGNEITIDYQGLEAVFRR